VAAKAGRNGKRGNLKSSIIRKEFRALSFGFDLNIFSVAAAGTISGLNAPPNCKIFIY
jgi:hypothetical protein